jgi:hypothetical protein
MIGIVGNVIYCVFLLAASKWNSCAPSYATILQIVYHLFCSVNVHRRYRMLWSTVSKFSKNSGSLLKVLVIRSYRTAGGRNKPYSCSTWTGGMKEYHICFWCYVECGTLLVLAVTVHMVHDTKGHRQITYWSSTEQFCMYCLQWHWYGGESYTDRAGLLESILVCSEAWSSVSTTVDCLVLSDGAHWMRNSYKLECLMFCSRGWVTVVE